jgi:hypothetical protein
MNPYLSEPMRELLSAIVETLDELPAPAPNPADEIAHRILVENRIATVTGSLKDVLAGDASCGLLWEAGFIRERAASVDQITYKTREQYIAEHEAACPEEACSTPADAACGHQIRYGKTGCARKRGHIGPHRDTAAAEPHSLRWFSHEGTAAGGDPA